MSFRNDLKSKKAQATIEYIVTFIVLTICVLFVAGSLNLAPAQADKIKMKSPFDTVVNNMLKEINQ